MTLRTSSVRSFFIGNEVVALNITGYCKEGVLTLNFSGELDQHTAREAAAALLERMDAFLPRKCILNLKELSFMDSSGIALILCAERKMKELEGSLCIRQISAQPLRVLKAAGLTGFIDAPDRTE